MNKKFLFLFFILINCINVLALTKLDYDYTTARKTLTVNANLLNNDCNSNLLGTREGEGLQLILAGKSIQEAIEKQCNNTLHVYISADMRNTGAKTSALDNRFSVDYSYSLWTSTNKNDLNYINKLNKLTGNLIDTTSQGSNSLFTIGSSVANDVQQNYDLSKTYLINSLFNSDKFLFWYLTLDGRGNFCNKRVRTAQADKSSYFTNPSFLGTDCPDSAILSYVTPTSSYYKTGSQTFPEDYKMLSDSVSFVYPPFFINTVSATCRSNLGSYPLVSSLFVSSLDISDLNLQDKLMFDPFKLPNIVVLDRYCLINSSDSNARVDMIVELKRNHFYRHNSPVDTTWTWGNVFDKVYGNVANPTIFQSSTRSEYLQIPIVFNTPKAPIKTIPTKPGGTTGSFNRTGTSGNYSNMTITGVESNTSVADIKIGIGDPNAKPGDFFQNAIIPGGEDPSLIRQEVLAEGVMRGRTEGSIIESMLYLANTLLEIFVLEYSFIIVTLVIINFLLPFKAYKMGLKNVRKLMGKGIQHGYTR